MRTRQPIGRHGLCLSVSRPFKKCRDCGEMQKLIGYICKSCYEKRNHRIRYINDEEYREKRKAYCREYNRKRRTEFYEVSKDTLCSWRHNVHNAAPFSIPNSSTLSSLFITEITGLDYACYLMILIGIWKTEELCFTIYKGIGKGGLSR